MIARGSDSEVPAPIHIDINKITLQLYLQAANVAT